MGLKTASIVLSLSTFCSYFLGFFRDKTLAYFFGQNGLTDVYNLAFTIPDFIFNFCIAGALTGVFIPIFIAHKEEGQEKADELASIFLSVMGVLITVICLIAWILTPWIMDHLLVHKENLQTSINLTRIMLLSPIILGLSNTIGSIHIAYKHFFAYSISAIMYNLGIILGIIFFYQWFGIYSAAIGVIVGALLHASIRIFDLKHVPFTFKWNFTFNHPGFRKILISMLPRSLGLASITGVTFFCGVMGPTLIKGGFTAYTYARNFQSFPVNFFGITLATAVLPLISELVHKKDHTGLSERMNTSLRQLLFLTVPAAVALSVLAPAVISVLRGGAFSAEDAVLTSTLLMILAISIPFESLTHLYTRGFNAYQNTYFPAMTNMIFAAIAVATILLTKDLLGVYSFALGWMSGATVQFLILFFSFHFIFKFGSLYIAPLLISILKVIITCTVMWTGLFFFFKYVPANVFTLLGGTFIGIALFFAISYLLKAEEMEALNPIIARFLPKK